jgi:hypothetical protein
MNLLRSRLRVISVGGRNWAIVDGKQWERATQSALLAPIAQGRERE